MTADTRDVVTVDSLIKDFRPGFGLRVKRVLHGVSFSVKQGEIFGFVGPNGSGKTTTLKVMMGLIRATSGSAKILDHDIKETSFRKHIGFLPENPYFYTYLTAREILHFYAKLSGLPAERRRDRVETLLGWVGLEHAANDRLKTYSKGMLQRVGIAQALVHEPSVVFLDEPMSGLDPIGRKEIRDIILRMKEEGKTVFMNTHILSDVEMICDRVAIIVAGKIRYQGSLEDFLTEEDLFSDVVLASLSADLVSQIEERFNTAFHGIGDRVEIRVKDKDVNDLLQIALAAGAAVISVTQNRVSLESIFLDAVRQSSQGGGDDSWRSDGPGAAADGRASHQDTRRDEQGREAQKR